MAVILGITDGDDSGAVVIVDGKLVSAVNEERMNRIKQSIGFPLLAVPEALRLAGVSASDVDHVAMAAHSETWVDGARKNDGWFAESRGFAKYRNEVASAFAKPLGSIELARKTYGFMKRMSSNQRRKKVGETLKGLGINAPLSYHDHHKCHAVAAFVASGFENAVTITLDGSGDGACSQVWTFDRKDGEQRLNRLDSIHSIGNFYAYVTHLCGFKANIHEGKITGLAAHGSPDYLSMFKSLIDYRDGQIENHSHLYYTGAVREMQDQLPADWQREKLACSVQQHLEDVAVAYVRHWMLQSGKRDVCLAGGVFANVRLNQKIAELEECDSLFVFPAMGDGGLAAGSAWDAAREAGDRPVAIDDVYLGSSFSEEEIAQALTGAGLEFARYDCVEKKIAELIHEGLVVARFDGAMEYGPRALGSRSILYRTTERSVNQWLNDRLNRTEFMPFAPACLQGHEDDLFIWNPAVARPTRYMTVTLDCTEWMKEHCPAVVHVDGTARPQIVDPESNPSFHRIIDEYYTLSGIPAVVNTSFNMHEEPIVRTPEDAIRAYQLGHLDCLAIGPFIVVQPEGGQHSAGSQTRQV